MNGIQPTPLSTETIFRSGWRSNTPDRIMFVTTRALPMNNIVPLIASCVFMGCEAHE